MSDKKQLTHMSQFSIIREIPGDSTAKKTLHDKSIAKKQQQQQQRTSELKFKIEPIGIQPEDDDDLETCPSRTRSSWPHQITPWWKPADRFEKPPYSYATLIAHAILTSKDGRLTLSDIYKWISEAYPYYKRGQKGWQNSIRHNLSLNKKWFIKVDRRPTQAHPGKGGYWTLQVNMEKIFVDNLTQAGGHSRRHHDMGMYASLSTQYYRSSSSSDNSEEPLEDDLSNNVLCPNIHITVPRDYEVKKTKSITPNTTVSAPRIRNMSYSEKNSLNNAVTATPKTDPKNFIIRFNPSEPIIKRRKSTDRARPPPKSGKRRNPVEPGSSTAEQGDEDSAVDVGSYSDAHTSKKRKSKTTESIDTITASHSYTLSYPDMSYNNLIRPSDVIGTISSDNTAIATSSANDDCLGFNNDFWMYGETEQAPASNTNDVNKMLLTSEYPIMFDVEAQNILNGLQQAAVPPQQTVTQHPDMKTIDLQFNSLEKSIHCPNMFDIAQFSDPNNNLFVADLNTYNLDQYVDFGGALMDDNQPSDLLLEDEATMNSYWPEVSPTCFMNFDSNNHNTNSMPFINAHDE